MEMLQRAFGDGRTKCLHIYEWYRRFKNGRISVEDHPRAGRVHSTQFFYYRGVVSYENVSHGTTVNPVFYREVLQRLQETARKKRPDLWREKSWLYHHDNALPHRALFIQEFLSRNSMPVVSQPPSSSYLSPADVFFHHFPRLKRALKARCFDSRQDVIAKSQEEPKTNVIFISIHEEAFTSW